MARYEYKVVPAPDRGVRAKGAKGTGGRFAAALGEAMNEMAALGWEYLRAESLPCVERKGLTGSATTKQHVLVFRRELDEVPEQVFTRSAGVAPSLGAASRAPVPRPERPLGPAEE